MNNEDYADHIHNKNKQTKKDSLALFFFYTVKTIICCFFATCESSCFPFFSF